MQRAGGAAMTDPITPPLEMLQQWASEYWCNPGECLGNGEKYIATKAAQWGADQELEACCGQLHRWGVQGIDRFRAARRPKPLSEADQALEALDRIDQLPTAEDQRIIRRALERLKEMEGQGND